MYQSASRELWNPDQRCLLRHRATPHCNFTRLTTSGHQLQPTYTLLSVMTPLVRLRGIALRSTFATRGINSCSTAIRTLSADTFRLQQRAMSLALGTTIRDRYQVLHCISPGKRPDSASVWLVRDQQCVHLTSMQDKPAYRELQAVTLQLSQVIFKT